MAAENVVARRHDSVFAVGFNEAAAHGRGKRRPPGASTAAAGVDAGASMRPRRMAAENGR